MAGPHNKVQSALHLKQVMDEYNINAGELATTLGISAGAVGRWINTGVSPKWTTIACEGLMRRRAGNTNGTVNLLVKAPDKSAEHAIVSVAEALQATIVRL